MESSAKYSLVGVFVLSFLAALVAAILWLSEATGDRDSKRFVIYIRNHSLAGLQVDSQVTMKGIKVGSVLGFRIPEDNVEQVKVEISVQGDTPVKTDTLAVIKRNLLTGLAWIELKGSTAASPALEGEPPGEDYPVIAEGRTDLDVLADSLPVLMADINEMVNKISGFASPENIENVKGTLANLERVSNTLAENDDHLAKTLRNMDKLSVELLEITEPLKKISSEADGVFVELKDELLETVQSAKSTVQTVDTETKKMSRSFQAGVDVALVDLSKLSKDLSRAARSVSAAMDELSNPRELITGPSAAELGPGE